MLDHIRLYRIFVHQNQDYNGLKSPKINNNLTFKQKNFLNQVEF